MGHAGEAHEPGADRAAARISDNASRILQEALVNAAHHAEASTLCANVVRENGTLRISVADNGRGFSFRGTYDLAALQQMQAGRGHVEGNRRVSALGGGLVISSSEAGAQGWTSPCRCRRWRADLPIRLLLADDHPIVLDGLDQLFRLENDFEVAGRCTHGKDVLPALLKLNPTFSCSTSGCQSTTVSPCCAR